MKPKKTLSYPVHELIEKRWSPRSFAGKPVSETDLLSMFEAARWSPSSYNEQPWRFIYTFKGTDPNYIKLFDTLSPSNKEWASRAPVLILALYRVRSEHTGELNVKATFDLGGAVANMILEATSRSISVHHIGGFNIPLATENFNIPEEYKPFVVLAVGYHGEPDVLPEGLKWKEESPQIRKKTSEIISNGTFNFNK